MNYQSSYDTCLHVNNTPNLPEVIYRSRGPCLSVLHSQRILGRNKNQWSEMDKGNPAYNIVNNLSPCNFYSSRKGSFKGFVQCCGVNHNKIELVAFGNNVMNSYEMQNVYSENDSCTDVDPVSKCFYDIWRAEYPLQYRDEMKSNDRSSNVIKNYSQSTHFTNELSFYPKRLLLLEPKSFGSDRICEIRIDDKHRERPIIYARNKNGLFISHVEVDPLNSNFSDSDSYYSLSKDWSGYPKIQQKVVTDLELTAGERINTLIVSPHEYGLLATVTRQNQFLLWDSLRSTPIHKVNLQKSTEYHVSHGEMYNKLYGCVASDFIECGAFTDRRDSLILGGSKLYLLDLRDKSLGFLFPRDGLRPPSHYRYSKMNSRLPLNDRIIAIQQHPSYSCLYALSSSVSSSILLWDIRNPHHILDEIPLPLVRQGRGRFRYLQWHPIPFHMTSLKNKNMFFLSSFCWEYESVSVTLLSVTNSSPIVSDSNTRQEFLKHNSPKISKEFSREPRDLNSLLPKASYSNNDTALQNHSEGLLIPNTLSSPALTSSSLFPYFVNPFILFHQSSPVDTSYDISSGLCFSSSSPPYQVIIYHQVQLPMGIPSLSSEMRYFSPLGPLIDHNNVLINEGLKSPLAEAPLSQLFHGIAGLLLVNIPFPDRNMYSKDRVIVLCLTFSGRLLATTLNIEPKKRKLMFDTMGKHKIQNQSVLNQFVDLYTNPQSERSTKQYTIAPMLPKLDELLFNDKNQLNFLPQDKNANDCTGSLYSKVITSNHFKYTQFNQTLENYSVYPFYLDKEMKLKKLNGLHDLLKPNHDILNYRPFIMGDRVNFTRKRLETLIMWQYPTFNCIYFSEAFLHIFDHANSPSPPPKSHILSLPVIFDNKNKNPSTVSNTNMNTSLSTNDDNNLLVSSMNFMNYSDYLDDIITTNKRSIFTFEELYLNLKDISQKNSLRNYLISKCNEGDIQFWIASSGSLDSHSTERLPFSHTSTLYGFSYLPIMHNTMTPLCYCSTDRNQVYSFEATNNSDDSTPWVTLVPKNTPIYPLSLAHTFFLQISKHEVMNSFLSNEQVLLMELSILQALCVPLITNAIGIWLPDSWGKHNALYHKNYVCQPNHFTNHYCLLPSIEIVDISKNDKAQNNQLDSSHLIQGSLFIEIDNNQIFQLNEYERNLVLEQFKPQYPKYFSFLSGIRITVQLYGNLEIEWERIKNESQSNWNAQIQPTNDFDTARSFLQYNPNSKFTIPRYICSASIDNSMDEKFKQNTELFQLLDLPMDRSRSSQTFFNSDSQGSQQSSFLMRLTASSQFFPNHLN